MRRARKHNGTRRLSVDLFPFLGIIVCVIGILVLLISGLAAAGAIHEMAIKERDRLEGQVALADQMIAAERSIQTALARKEEAEKAIAAETAQMDNLAKVRQNFDVVQKQVDAADPKTVEAMLKELARLKVTTAALLQEAEQLQPRIAKRKVDAGEAQRSVTIPLFGGNSKIKPVYIECHQAGLTIYRVMDHRLTTRDIGLEDIKDGQEFADLVRDIAESAKRGQGDVLNLMVRSNGVTAYDRAMIVIRKKETPYASVPITVPGKVRFRDPTTSLPVN